MELQSIALPTELPAGKINFYTCERKEKVRYIINPHPKLLRQKLTFLGKKKSQHEDNDTKTTTWTPQHEDHENTNSYSFLNLDLNYL